MGRVKYYLTITAFTNGILMNRISVFQRIRDVAKMTDVVKDEIDAAITMRKRVLFHPRAIILIRAMLVTTTWHQSMIKQLIHKFSIKLMVIIYFYRNWDNAPPRYQNTQMAPSSSEYERPPPYYYR
jgi:hypothetical protein